MSNKFRIILLLVVFVGVAIFEGLPTRIENWVKSDKSSTLSGQLTESLSGTLRGPLDSRGILTVAGTVEATNKQRELYGKNALHVNSKLNLAAQAKVEDMFRQQYFEHVSPDGKHPSDVISATSYEYLVVGENLALGNYENDEALVEAWMNSPGHRANILDGKFEEIGVAVGKGMYEGRETWLAVQEFGTPLASCPGPGASLKANIERNRLDIKTQEASLDQLKRKIDANNYSSRSEYEADVARYNSQANQLNKLIDQTKSLVNDYNMQVNSFNRCLESDK